MAYSRFGTNSDIYLVHSAQYGLECLNCKLTHHKSNLNTKSLKTKHGAIKHLLAHRSHGHKVPERAILRLSEEIAEEKYLKGA